jgi:integrase
MTTRRRRGFGKIRKLPSGRFQASYVGPDGRRHTAPTTYDTRGDAEAWLAAAQTDISREQWHRPAPTRRVDTFADYSAGWLESRLSRGQPLTPRTRSEYRKLLDKHLLPTFGDLPLDEITPVLVRNWHGGLTSGPTSQAHAYGLLRAILNTAVADDAITVNPCKIRGAGTTRRARTPKPASLAELAVIVDEMPERYRPAILVAAWCGLRFGEFAELRRRDVDLAHARLRVRRAVTHVDGRDVVGSPKSEAGVRDVSIPPHLIPVVEQHLQQHVDTGREALLFPAPTGGHLRSDSVLHDAFRAARVVAGRPDLTVHGLRHTGATLAAATGATLAELMRRLGRSTAVAAMRYQHATDDRDRAIADALSGSHASNVVALRPKEGRTA